MPFAWPSNEKSALLYLVTPQTLGPTPHKFRLLAAKDMPHPWGISTAPYRGTSLIRNTHPN